MLVKISRENSLRIIFECRDWASISPLIPLSSGRNGDILPALAGLSPMQSEIARRFGATIKLEDLKTPSKNRQMFLVRGGADAQTFAGLVARQGGKVVLAGKGFLLAEMGYNEAMALRSQHGVRSVNGVSIDPARFESFMALLKARPVG